MSRTDPDSGGVEPQVRAGGGVVWRLGTEGIEVLLVHRPRYHDWTLPKGKCEPGEAYRAAAEREVLEETGLTCSVGAELTTVHYRDGRGRSKRVRYWAMQVAGGRFEPNDEVDRVRWLPLAQAIEVLTYAHDRPVLDGLPQAI